MKRTEYVLRRGGIYLLGLFVMALGVSISKASDLGVSPVNSIPSVVSEITGVDMGCARRSCLSGLSSCSF